MRLKSTLLIIIFNIFNSYTQIATNPFTDDAEILNQLNTDWTLGNPCNVPYYIDTNIYGNLYLKGYTNYIQNAKLTVHGNIITDGGQIILKCLESILIELGSLSIINQNKRIFRIYPNPAENHVFIIGDFLKKISIYNIYGQLIFSKKISKQKEKISLPNISQGLYIIFIIGRTGSESKRLIIMK